ncbi:MAG: cobalt ECF transporter T component CbiQ [Firmicutes bacterium]|nr:cobalt ECF transporter T component CbiQ [Bacillota bacterium]
MELDRWAYINRMRHVHPGEKILFTIGLLIICLASPFYRICGSVFLVALGTAWLGAGIPLLACLRALLVPLLFLLPSVAAVMLSIPPLQPAIWSVWVGPLEIGISSADVQRSVLLASRALGAVGAVFFLVLTTPMVDLLQQLRRWHVPPLFMDLMELVYRFIFVTLETGQRIIAAQSLRLGYCNLSVGLRSLGQGLAVLLARSLHRADLIHTALECRLYSGTLQTLEQEYKRNLPLEIAMAAIIFVLAGWLVYGGIAH